MEYFNATVIVITNKFNGKNNFNVLRLSKNENVLSFIKTKKSDTSCVKR